MTTLAPPAAIAGSPRIGAQRVGQPGHAGGHHPSEIATSPPKLPMRKRPPGRTVSAPPRTLSWDASGSTTRTVPPPDSSYRRSKLDETTTSWLDPAGVEG